MASSCFTSALLFDTLSHTSSSLLPYPRQSGLRDVLMSMSYTCSLLGIYTIPLTNLPSYPTSRGEIDCMNKRLENRKQYVVKNTAYRWVSTRLHIHATQYVTDKKQKFDIVSWNTVYLRSSYARIQTWFFRDWDKLRILRKLAIYIYTVVMK